MSRESAETNEPIYIIMSCYECDDPYYPPNKHIHSLYKTMEAAIEYLHVLTNEERYTQNFVYYEIIKGDFQSKGSNQRIYSTQACYASCVCDKYTSLPPHLHTNKKH